MKTKIKATTNKMSKWYQSKSNTTKSLIIAGSILALIILLGFIYIFFIKSYTPITDAFRDNRGNDPKYYATNATSNRINDMHCYSLITDDAEYIIVPYYNEETEELFVRSIITNYDHSSADIYYYESMVYMEGKYEYCILGTVQEDPDSLVYDYYINHVDREKIEKGKCSFVILDSLAPIEIWFTLDELWLNFVY